MADGILLIDKPSGITSHDAVDAVRRSLGIRKVGHAGTLDPMARGLLVMGVGRGTRLLRFLGDLEKEYEGTARLGVETDTLDAEGRVVREAPVDVSEAAVREAMAGFVGEIEQRPPAYSAVKVGGRRLYRAARSGERVEAAPRRVRVDRFELLRWDRPDLDFLVVCSSGTYVRSLLADLGTRLRCGGHLTRLVRTRIGAFHLEEAAPPDRPGSSRPLLEAVEHLPRVVLDREEARAARHGRALGPAGMEGPYGLVDPEGRLVGVYLDEGARARPQVVVPE